MVRVSENIIELSIDWVIDKRNTAFDFTCIKEKRNTTLMET